MDTEDVLHRDIGADHDIYVYVVNGAFCAVQPYGHRRRLSYYALINVVRALRGHDGWPSIVVVVFVFVVWSMHFHRDGMK